MDVEVRTQAGVKILKLRGKLMLGPSLDKLRGKFTDLQNAGEARFLLDLADVPMIDSSGIGLVRFLTTAKQSGGALKLLNPSKFALQTLKLVRVLNLFEVFEDPDSAVASFE